MNKTTYILQKDIPDAKSGTEFISDGRNHYDYVSTSKMPSWYDECVVEHNPEWFLPKQEDKPKEWEILFIIYKGRDKLVPYSEPFLPEYWDIHSVKRLSDNSIWSVGQVGLHGQIKSIKIIDGQLVFEIKNNVFPYDYPMYISELKPKQQPVDTDAFNHDKINKQLEHIHYLQALGCDLISRIYHYGNFKAETVNERLLETILNELKLFPTTEEEILKRPPLPEQSKPTPKEESIKVNRVEPYGWGTLPHQDNLFAYQFATDKKVPPEKYESVKKAIETILNEK